MSSEKWIVKQREEIMSGSFWMKPDGEKFNHTEILLIIGDN